MKKILFATIALASLTFGGVAAAEVSQIRAAQQWGLSSLPLMIMQEQKLVEKHSEALGVPVAVEWVRLGGPGAINEAMIAGDLDFASAGVPSLLTLWDRTRGSRHEIRGVAAVTEMPMDLMTSKESIKSIADFTDDDRIAVTTIRVSNQALLLQMAAAQLWGADQYDKLDHLTVSLPHPEAMGTLLSGSDVISAHFSGLPFQFIQAQQPGIHTVTSSYDILGGPASNTVAFTSLRFYNENPKVYAAFVAALEEAAEIINSDFRAAAEAFVRISNSQESVDTIEQMLNDPRVAITLQPRQTLKIAHFMHQIGRLKANPEIVTDFFIEGPAVEGAD